jgi:hypothetical protein
LLSDVYNLRFHGLSPPLPLFSFHGVPLVG